jgi:hypothetical protein
MPMIPGEFSMGLLKGVGFNWNFQIVATAH